jgi:nitroreductase
LIGGNEAPARTCDSLESWEEAMKIEAAILGRRSVREYTGEAVDEQTIRRLIGAAILAPNAVNQQPCTFTVVRERTRLDCISRQAKAHMLATMDASAHSEHFRTLLGDSRYDIFHGAPALVVISATAPGPWIVEDCALAAENLMLAAFAEGLGTCWIGFAQGFLNTLEGKAALGAPAAWVPVAPIIVGRPKAWPAATARKAPEILWVD